MGGGATGNKFGMGGAMGGIVIGGGSVHSVLNFVHQLEESTAESNGHAQMH